MSPHPSRKLVTKPASKWRIRASSMLLRAIARLENQGNCDAKANGEDWLLDSIFFDRRGQRLCVLDVGANVGGYSKLCLEAAARHGVKLELHAFEPNPNAFALLRASVGSEPGVALHAFGAGELTDTLDLHIDSAASGWGSLFPREVILSQSRVERVSVQIRRLEEMIESAKLPGITLLKLDVEGYELAALKGLGKYLDPNFIDFIQFEYGGTTMDAGNTLRDFFRLLEGRGFELCKLFPSHLEQRSYGRVLENFDYANYVALGRRARSSVA